MPTWNKCSYQRRETVWINLDNVTTMARVSATETGRYIAALGELHRTRERVRRVAGAALTNRSRSQMRPGRPGRGYRDSGMTRISRKSLSRRYDFQPSGARGCGSSGRQWPSGNITSESIIRLSRVERPAPKSQDEVVFASNCIGGQFHGHVQVPENQPCCGGAAIDACCR